MACTGLLVGMRCLGNRLAMNRVLEAVWLTVFV